MAAPTPTVPLSELLDRVLGEVAEWWSRDAAPKTTAFQQEVEALSADEQAALVLLAMGRVDEFRRAADDPAIESDWEQRNHRLRRWNGALSVGHALLARTLPWTDAQLSALVDLFVNASVYSESWFPIGGLLKQLESAPDQMANPAFRDRVIAVRKRLAQPRDAAGRRLHERFRTLFGEAEAPPVEAGEAWSDRAIADLASMPTADQAGWTALLLLCAQAPGGAPTAKWSKAAAQALGAVGSDAVVRTVLPWFALVDKPRTAERAARHQYEPDYTHRISDAHMDLLKGLCWIAGTMTDPELARSLGALALSAYRKVPGVGPRAVKVGNAAVYALGRMPGMDALGQLAMLRVKVKFGTAQKGIEKALNAKAEAMGLPRDQIEELGVPSYGLTEVGRRLEPIGGFTAELVVTGIGDTELRWLKTGGGKPQRSVPAAVKTEHAEELKDLKAAAKDIEKMLPAQRDRIDSLFLEEKRWPFGAWRERYLDHPLIGVLARRLIWTITDGSGATVAATWLDESNTLVDRDGRPAAFDGATATVRLWHPIGRPTEEVLAWRRFFEDRTIRQPFKQAHREVYLLTDAERRTGTYSNRFAAHVIKQHQFNALCAVRGWKNKLRLLVDDEYPPATRSLPAWGLRAEFWIEGVGGDYGTDTNEAGVFNYLTTDQVRFYPIAAATRSAHAGGGGYRTWGEQGTDTPLPIEQVPALVLSEVLRDVDLFVGVCSVGNNPQWNDGGPEGRYVEYWNNYSFGELSQAGAGRREFLERLLPRLKIADRCTLAERFLVVRGTLRTYKIHLGSGNILMEPNDQYLCIVPGQGAAGADGAGEVFLPFEGDRTLSIILSKAFMLAADDRITDPSIKSQIGSRKK